MEKIFDAIYSNLRPKRLRRNNMDFCVSEENVNLVQTFLRKNSIDGNMWG